MQRSPSDLARDAIDIARRTSTQLLVLVGALLLVWLGDLEGRYEAIHGPIKKIAEKEQEIKKLNTQLEAISYEWRTKRDDVISSRADLDRARSTVVARNAVGIEALDGARRRLDQALKEAMNAQVAAEQILAERLSIDLGSGLKVPVPFKVASLAWSIVFVFVAARVLLQRQRIWTLLHRAAQQVRSSTTETSAIADLVSDLPFWLAPMPTRGCGIAPDRDMLKRIVAWNNIAVRSLLVGFGVIVGIIVLYRVVWIGLVVSWISDTGPAYPTIVALLLAAAIATVLSILLLVPGRWPSEVAPGREVVRERRLLIGSMAVIAAVFVARAPWTGGYYQYIKDKFSSGIELVKIFRYRKRSSPYADLAAAGLEPGLYRNRRNDAVHYVDGDGRVTDANNGLQSSSLEPLREFPVGFNPGGAVGVAIERNAIRTALDGDPGAGCEYLISAISRSRRLNTRHLDLAAGIAIYFDRKEQLERLVALARSYPAGRGSETQIGRRIVRWKESSDESRRWRNSRWPGRPFPFRWDGQRYDA